MLRCTVKLRVHRLLHDLAAVATGHKVYAFGGFTRDPWEAPEDQINVSVFNTESLRWMKFPPVKTRTGERPPEVPCDRRLHTALLIEDIVYVWGGMNRQHNLCNNTLCI